MVLDPENFMRRSDEFAHSKATLHKFIALSPQQADGVLTMNKFRRISEKIKRRKSPDTIRKRTG